MKLLANLKISDREGLQLLHVGGLFFLIMLGIAFGRIGRDALFIQEVGAGGLSIIYICNAILMTLISAVYARVYDRLSRISFLIGLLFSAAGLVCGLRFMLQADVTLLYYVLYIFSESVILLVPMHFWTFANEVFDPRQGKRIFPLIGAAGLVGTIAGGILTGFFSGQIGTANLLLVWAGLLVTATPLALRFRMIFGRISPFGEGRADAGSLRENFGSIWNIPLVRTLCYMAVPMWLTVYSIDYQFFLALEETFHSPDEMSTALGVVHGITSGLGLIIQIFFTSRLIKSFGVGRAVMSYPISMSLGSLGMLIRLALPAGIGTGVLNLRFIPAFFARVSDEAVVGSVGDSSTQLLYHAIVDEWRGHARAFISAIMEPASIALAGVLLLAYGALEIPNHFLPVFSLILVSIWLWMSWRIRADYMNALVDNLNSHNIDAQNHALSELGGSRDPHAERWLFSSLFSGEEQVALMSVEMLSSTGSRQNLLELADAVDVVPLARVKIAILKTLAERSISECYERIHGQLQSEDPEVRAATVRTAGLLGHVSSLSLLEPFLSDPDPDVRAEALIVHLRERKRLDGRNRAVRELRKLIKSPRAERRLRAAYIIRESGKKQLHDDLITLSRGRNLSIRREVLRALGVIGDEETLLFLRGFLDDEQMVYHAMEAVEQVGARHVGRLLRMVEEETEEPKKESMIHCLGKIGDPRAVHVLAGLLSDHSIDIENATLDSMTQIRAKLLETGQGGREDSPLEAYFNEGVMRVAHRGMHALTLSIRKKSWALQVVDALEESDARWLLHDALLRSYARKEKAALKYLELLADPVAIRAAASDLRSGEERAQAEAIELIESIGPEGEKLARAIEPKYFPVEHETSAVPDPSVLPLVLMEQLMSKEHPWFYACLLFAIGEFKLGGLTDVVRGQATSHNPLIRGNARLALSKLALRKKRNQTREVKKMAVNMERMLFLRSVPLFSEVDGDDIFWINEITREQRYSGGEIIFHENDEGDALYIIVSGSVRIIKGLEEQVTLDVLQGRDVFGEMSILDQEPRSATIETIEDTRLLVIMRDDFQRLLLARPRIAFSLFRTLSGRLRHLSTRLREVESKHEHAATGKA